MTRVFSCLYHFSFPYLRNYCDLYLFVQVLEYICPNAQPQNRGFQFPSSPETAPSPLLLCGPLPSCWMTGGCPETLLICSAGWIVHTCFYFLLFFFGFCFIFLKLMLQHLPKKRFIDLGCQFASLCMFGNF